MAIVYCKGLKSPNSTIKSLAIQGHLNGKSRDQIAKETGASAGKISYILNDWKREIGIPDIDQLRAFAITVKKSGISIAQCAQGYRTVQLMKSLGVVDDDDDSDDNSSNIKFDGKNIEFHTFVGEIYLNSKNLGVPPSIIPLWIKDMLDFYANPNTDFSAKLKTDLSDVKIPFISQISYYIDQKKKECADLEGYKRKLKEDITNLEIQKSNSIESLDRIKQEEKDVLSYLPFINNLEEMLWNNYSIKIKDDIQRFSQLINDFKEHGYHAEKIIQEYLKSLSLKLMISTNEAEIATLAKQKASLNNSVLSLESQINSHTQTMNIYYELEGMRFGLKELKQLYYVIHEIAEVNKISSKEAVSKFLKDIEEQYDDKLGFESKVQEKKEELFQLNNKITRDRILFQLHPSIGPTLSNLLQNGITEQDITYMNQLVEQCNNNPAYSDSIPVPSPSPQNYNNKNNTIGTHRNNRLKNWKLLIDDLKRYRDIKLIIKDQMEKRDTITKEIDDMQKQKQEISVHCQNGISFISEINSKLSYFKGHIDHYNKDLDNKIKASSKTSGPLPIFIICNNSEKNKEKEDNKDNRN